MKPDFVLLNFLRVMNEDLADWLLCNGVAVGVLDTEGSVFFPIPRGATTATSSVNGNNSEVLHAFEEYAISMTRKTQLRHSIQLICVWTPEFADYAVKSGWYKESQIAVTGTPRSDFYASQWRETALNISDYVDEYDRPLILINGNFTIANPKFQTPESEIQMMIDMYSYDRGFLEKWQEAQRTAMKGIIEVANALAMRFPQTTFIVRPHPFENEETYHQGLEKYPNLKVVKKGTVDSWLLRAKALIHWGSSTAVDATALGVPSFVPAWLPTHLSLPAIEPINILAANLETLIEQIGSVLSGTFQQPSDATSGFQQVVEKIFYRIDGNSHRRVADAIMKAMPVWKPRIRAAIKWKIQNLKQSLLLITQRLPQPPVDWDKSDKRFLRGDIEKIIATISANHPSARYPKIIVTSAQEAGVYGRKFPEGRSLVMQGLK